MTTRSLLAILSSLGVRLWAEGTKLRYLAPPGALSPELKENLTAHKGEIISILGTPPSDLPVSGATLQPLSNNSTEARLSVEDRQGEASTSSVAVSFAPPATARSSTTGHSTSRSVEGYPPSSEPIFSSSVISRAKCMDGKELFDLAHNENVPAAERAMYRQEILSRSDALIGESEGYLPPPNPSVHVMLNEAHERFAWRQNEQKQCVSGSLPDPGVRDGAYVTTDGCQELEVKGWT